MKPSVMQIPSGYVAGFDEEHQIVTSTEDGHKAVVFYSVDEVEEFVNEYSDAGFGLSSDNYTLIELIDVDSE